MQTWTRVSTRQEIVSHTAPASPAARKGCGGTRESALSYSRGRYAATEHRVALASCAALYVVPITSLLRSLLDRA
jgi:hypothetical protein